MMYSPFLSYSSVQIQQLILLFDNYIPIPEIEDKDMLISLFNFQIENTYIHSQQCETTSRVAAAATWLFIVLSLYSKLRLLKFLCNKQS